jgi:TPR repeat protein
VQIRILLAAVLLGVTPSSFADEVPDIDARIAQGRALLIRIGDLTSALVHAQSADAVAAAIAGLEVARDQGASNAAYQLGFVYLAGRFGVEPDIAEAQRNYELAVAQELPVALGDYGLMLHTGRHFPKDEERGLELLNRAAQLGARPATAFLIKLLRDTGNAGDAEQADAWFESLGMRDEEFLPGIDGDPSIRAQDYAVGQANIHAMYLEGVILQFSQARADAWLGQIDAEHAAIALDNVAALLSSGSHVRSDQRLAKSLLQLAVRSDNASIVNNYAWLLATARSAELRDGAEAVRLMEDLFGRVEPRGFMVDTMAAAYAEAGDFAAAIAEQDRANELFAAESLDPAIGIEHRESYLAGRAWRE